MVDANVGTMGKVLGGVLLPPVWDGGDIAKILVQDFGAPSTLQTSGWSWTLFSTLFWLSSTKPTYTSSGRTTSSPLPSPRNWEIRAKLGYEGHSHLNPSKPEPPHVG